MMDWMVKVQPISLIVGSLFGLMFMKLKMKSQGIPYERIMDAVTNGVFIIVLTWKFMPTILNPGWAFQSPWQALLAVGSAQHIIIGCLIASGYVIWRRKKVNFSLFVLLDALPFGIGSMIIFYFLFHQHVGVSTTMPWGMKLYDSKFSYHPIYMYEIMIAICIMGWLWIKNERLGTRKYMSYFLIVEGIAHIFISLISEQVPLLFGLSMQQILIFAVISTGILLLPKKNSNIHKLM
ncbi:prolipoprotein diacylglyceryl transferase family protein [Bacillus sp. XF8]|uniref:prolipoprotein diacylglyceryl transferase family protein n=1 Tax=Bacillus sp. XF8 TaxID=2819289 RepID=UPI001AA08FEE|nr:prolipoprotein diacylglyceryl transferase family protein [Bacillus sp. XF8]MBO1578571.1 prolipoprotein diacylglyceryl transferase [Bacillus sp. XF8]